MYKHEGILALCIIILAMLGMIADQATSVHAQNDPLSNITQDITRYDLQTDDSLYKYVSSQTPFIDPSYEPYHLVNIADTYFAIGTQDPRLRPEATYAATQLAQAFFEEFGYKLYLVSAYRSYKNQEHLIHSGCSKNRCAEAGSSEHQAGLAIDIHVADKKGRQLASIHDQKSKYYQRLKHNAHKFGRHNTFQKGAAIDGQMAEGRHRRYLGIPLATHLYETHLSFAEYYKQHSSGNQ